MLSQDRKLRREEIRRILREEAVETQEHLGALLKKAGFNTGWT